MTDILNAYVRRDEPDFSKWTLDEARYLSGLLPHVEFFIEDFTSSAFSLWPAATATPTRLTPSERCRIAGTFSRFEIYCNLFRKYRDGFLHPEIQEELFLRKFPPWENELLGSVYDYFVGKVIPGMANCNNYGTLLPC